MRCAEPTAECRWSRSSEFLTMLRQVSHRKHPRRITWRKQRRRRNASAREQERYRATNQGSRVAHRRGRRLAAPAQLGFDRFVGDCR